jgi:hypothetical protein
MTNGDPPRLKTDRSLDPKLGRALRALGSRGSQAARQDAARMARVSQRLGALLDAPAPAYPLKSGWSRYAHHTSRLARWLLLGVALGAPVLWYLQSPPHVQLAAAPAQPVVSIATLAPPAPESPPMAADAVPPSAAPSPVVAAPVSKALARASRPKPALSPSAALKPSTGPAPLETRSETAVAAAPALQAAPTRPEPEAEAKKQSEPARPRPTEPELLFEARKAGRRQPQRALSILQEHAALYPRGLLAPEREVLSIEALRQLGRTKEADERLRLFRAQYPESLHLRRLSP